MPIQKGPANLGTGTIDATELASNSVTTAKIADANVTTAKLATTLTVTHALGSASTPSITFTGDTNTGIFSPTADTIAFAEGGAEIARFDSSGNLGVGTDSPAFASGTGLEVQRSGDATVRVERTGATNSAGEFVASSGLVKIGATSGSPLVFITDNTERLRIPSDAGGITFPATQVASSNANTLDDYEEGTYTPVVSGSTSGGPFTFGTQSGYYTKIGREVKVSMFMSHNSSISLGGAYKISLPFTVADYAGGGFVSYFANWTSQSPRIFQVEASTTYGYLRSVSTTEILDIQSGWVGNNTSYMLTIIYKTT
jgi:hypothetical protein